MRVYGRSDISADLIVVGPSTPISRSESASLSVLQAIKGQKSGRCGHSTFRHKGVSVSSLEVPQNVALEVALVRAEVTREGFGVGVYPDMFLHVAPLAGRVFADNAGVQRRLRQVVRSVILICNVRERSR